ncbi:hypothetical protein V1525DRAFT_173594 [Lipomyces kononenkoae]|uniref:Uncharacterized protein n=1 Tax=Lipomyces kononenkoae TaxID=34357 RepID=A0ACC3T0J7_LIPKO
MDARPLVDMLQLTCSFLPDSGGDGNDKYMIQVANHHYDGRRLISALLTHGKDLNSIADDLWSRLVVLRSRVDHLSVFFPVVDVPSLFDLTSTCGRISPNGITWREASVGFSESNELIRTMLEWTKNIFDNLLFPMRRWYAIPPSLKSSSRSSSSRNSSVRALILRRDGPLSPIGRGIDTSAWEDLQDANPERVSRLEAAHIMPSMLSSYSPMQSLLSMFAGSNLKSRLIGKSITGPSNIFCTDGFTHLLFDQFVIGVEYVNDQYRLRKVVARKARGLISRFQDGDELVFGPGQEGTTIDLPDGELFNIHLAIANVLHASGAGEVINKILQDEDDYKEGIVKYEATSARILAFALQQALNGLQADSVQSPDDEDDDNNKAHQWENTALRVVTNSHTNEYK